MESIKSVVSAAVGNWYRDLRQASREFDAYAKDHTAPRRYFSLPFLRLWVLSLPIAATANMVTLAVATVAQQPIIPAMATASYELGGDLACSGVWPIYENGHRLPVSQLHCEKTLPAKAVKAVADLIPA